MRARCTGRRTPRLANPTTLGRRSVPRSISRKGVGTWRSRTRIISSGVIPLAAIAATKEPAEVPTNTSKSLIVRFTESRSMARSAPTWYPPPVNPPPPSTRAVFDRRRRRRRDPLPAAPRSRWSTLPMAAQVYKPGQGPTVAAQSPRRPHRRTRRRVLQAMRRFLAASRRNRRLLALVALLATASAPAAARAQGPATLQGQLARAVRGAPAASGVFVRDLDSGRVLFDRRSAVPRIPASVEKLYTTSTLWLRLGPLARPETRVAGLGYTDPAGTVWHGNLYLEGGGDPSLSTTGLAVLARDIAGAGYVRVTGRVVGDESWFDTARGGPRTGYAYDSDVGGVLGALTVNRGWSRRGGPAAEDARRLTPSLKAQGARFARRASVGPTPAGARELARLPSPTVAQLTRATLLPSDNFYAETLLKAVGARVTGLGTTAAGAAVALRTLGGLRGNSAF